MFRRGPVTMRGGSDAFEDERLARERGRDAFEDERLARERQWLESR
jgi:hypothetical protein